MHLAKKGIRVLGIAESFSSDDRSILAGIVMRKDLRIDGFSFSRSTVGGSDATDAVIALYRHLRRKDINVIMISGGIISWFNIVDPERIYQETGKGTIVVTYEASDGLEEDIRRHFPGDTARIEAYRALGQRVPVSIQTGHTIFIRPAGITNEEAAALCDGFTLDGRIPEPLRAARICARAAMWFSMEA